MHEVLRQADRAADGFKPDPVHDLRVALRRCRSVAEGLRAIDPDPRWKKMRRSAKELFASLGRLRDAQVMMEWITRLFPGDDASARSMTAYCLAQEQGLKKEAELVLDAFDRRQWQAWARVLPARAARLQSKTEPFEALALERWMSARRLHNEALRTGKQATLHRLRIGIKKFRYVVEHFLPALHLQWSQGLKRFQDTLGEIQDLNVLWETALRIGAVEEPGCRETWQTVVLGERDARIERYKEETAGDDSLWSVWRSGLPRGRQAKEVALKKLETWAAFHDPDVRHSRRVGRLALQIHLGLERLGLVGRESGRSRELLVAASRVIGVGRSAGGRHRAKRGERIVRNVERPFTLSRQDLDMIAAIVRFYRGSFPVRGSLRRFPPATQKLLRRLVGIVRLANALAAAPATVGRIALSDSGDSLRITANGLDPQSAAAERVAAARYLLELSLSRPVVFQSGS
jgi:CHAD domain-containing protein